MAMGNVYHQDTTIRLVIGLVTLLVAIIQTTTASSVSYHRVCLIEPDGRYRPGRGAFSVVDITDPHMCTHLVYGPAMVDGQEAGLVLTGAYDEDNLFYLTSLRAGNPELSVLVWVGGTNGGSQGFEMVANDTESGERFAQNCLDFVRDRSLDGILIDWAPTLLEDETGHLDNFTGLLETLSSTMKTDVTARETTVGVSSSLLMCVAISGDRDTMESFYPLDTLAQLSDLILVKTFDFFTSDIPVIGHQSSLYPREDEDSYFTVLNLDFAVQYLLYLDVPSYKLVVGIPSHGRTLQFVNESLQYFGADHSGPGAPGPYSQQVGKMTYFEICDLLTSGWVESFHQEHQVPFAFSDLDIVTYDNTESVVNKVNYVKDQQLGGLFISSLADDDFGGDFCLQGPFPLTNTIKTTLTQTRDNCYPGEYGSVDLPGCAPCPRGSYQSRAHQTQCNPCPVGYSTLEVGAKDPQECVVDCGSGYEYNYISQSCDICPLGYFRDAQVDAHCYQCPVGMTTVAKGSRQCVDDPAEDYVTEDGVDERVGMMAVVRFEARSCENEPVIVSVITQVIRGLVEMTSSEWPSLCHHECSNLRLDKHQSCTPDGRGVGGSIGVQVRLDNISLSTDNGQHVRLATKVLEQALHQEESYEDLENYGVTFKVLEPVSATVMCHNGSALADGRCEPCVSGTFHNLTSSACQRCPLGTYTDVPEMTSCLQCQGVTSTLVSGATSASQCVSPCHAKPDFCHNGGLCHWSERDASTLYCQCLDGYTGDRCDVITDTQVDTGVIVGSSIGAVVVLLMVALIVLTLVTCVRYAKIKNRRRPNSSPDNAPRQGQGTGQGHHLSSLHPPVTHHPGKTMYVASGRSPRGPRLTDYPADYYNWMYLSQNYFLSPTAHQAQLLHGSPRELKVVPAGAATASFPPLPIINHSAASALPSPDLSGHSRSSKYTCTGY